MKVEVTFAKAFVVPPVGQTWFLQFPDGMTREQLDEFYASVKEMFKENPPGVITGCSVVEAVR
jgi:hypothetical protein